MSKNDQATHPCDACGGQGLGDQCECLYICTCGAELVPCPVCLGAGRFPDRMPVADALADAETLRPYIAYDHNADAAVHFVHSFAHGCIRCVSPDGTPHFHEQYAHFAAQAAYNAAGEAFRAVPGLRED